jgi:glutaredoxin
MNFTVYSKEGCPYCTKIVEILTLKKFKYVEYKLNEHFDRFAFTEEFGGDATFPQVMINGQKMGGCTETVKYLREHNMV